MTPPKAFLTAIGLALILSAPPHAFAQVDAAKLVAASRSQIGVTKSYDPAYRTLPYPGGDVPVETGVCTDVLIRALRKQSIDLQKLVHEDMLQLSQEVGPEET